MKKLSVFLSALVLAFGVVGTVNSAPIYNPNNGHHYERIDNPDLTSDLYWDVAKTESESMLWMGVNGHLATITSADENQWIIDNLGGALTLDHWLGGFQDPQGSEPDEGWQWVTGEPWVYTNWFPGEPGGSGSVLEFDDDESTPSILGYWNDYSPTGPSAGYIVEYDTPVPIPSTIWLLGSTLIGLVGFRKKISKE